jgi:hypothetical protein
MNYFKNATIFFVLFLVFSGFYISPSSIYARIGVGVGTGKIQLDEGLNSGTLYELPSITVLNTGDESGEYELDVTFHEQQKEMRPNKEWFKFSPEIFLLEPGEVKEVKIQLKLPIKTVPGNYFAYIEARPLATVKSKGGANIGVAAASKLYFDINPDNIFYGIGYRLISLWNLYSPVPQILLVILSIVLIYKKLTKHINFSISFSKKNTSKDTEKNPEKDPGKKSKKTPEKESSDND